MGHRLRDSASSKAVLDGGIIHAAMQSRVQVDSKEMCLTGHSVRVDLSSRCCCIGYGGVVAMSRRRRGECGGGQAAHPTLIDGSSCNELDFTAGFENIDEFLVFVIYGDQVEELGHAVGLVISRYDKKDAAERTYSWSTWAAQTSTTVGTFSMKVLGSEDRASHALRQAWRGPRGNNGSTKEQTGPYSSALCLGPSVACSLLGEAPQELVSHLMAVFMLLLTLALPRKTIAPCVHGNCAVRTSFGGALPLTQLTALGDSCCGPSETVPQASNQKPGSFCCPGSEGCTGRTSR